MINARTAMGLHKSNRVEFVQFSRDVETLILVSLAVIAVVFCITESLPGYKKYAPKSGAYYGDKPQPRQYSGRFPLIRR